jgi:hypothetical protein
MCLIIVKPKKAKLKAEYIVEGARYNDDGCGFMLVKDGKVVIHKGMDNPLNLQLKLKEVTGGDVDKYTVIYHFRIKTHGDKCPENTHPFPMTDSSEGLRALHTECDLAMAHNGQFKWAKTDTVLSDTQMAIKDMLCKFTFDDIKNKSVNKMLHMLFDKDKVCFLHKSGKFTLFGSWVVMDGCMFSNESFVPIWDMTGLTQDANDEAEPMEHGLNCCFFCGDKSKRTKLRPEYDVLVCDNCLKEFGGEYAKS